MQLVRPHLAFIWPTGTWPTPTGPTRTPPGRTQPRPAQDSESDGMSRPRSTPISVPGAPATAALMRPGRGQPRDVPSTEADGLDVWQPHHAERVDQPDQAGEDGHEQRDLERDVPSVCVDPQDLLLDRFGFLSHQLVDLGVAHHLSIVLEGLGDLILLVGRDHRACVGHPAEAQREGRQHETAGDRQTERQTERPGSGVDPGRLADPLLLDGRQACSC